MSAQPSDKKPVALGAALESIEFLIGACLEQQSGDGNTCAEDGNPVNAALRGHHAGYWSKCDEPLKNRLKHKDDEEALPPECGTPGVAYDGIARVFPPFPHSAPYEHVPEAGRPYRDQADEQPADWSDRMKEQCRDHYLYGKAWRPCEINEARIRSAHAYGPDRRKGDESHEKRYDEGLPVRRNIEAGIQVRRPRPWRGWWEVARPERSASAAGMDRQIHACQDGSGHVKCSSVQFFLRDYRRLPQIRPKKLKKPRMGQSYGVVLLVSLRDIQ